MNHADQETETPRPAKGLVLTDEQRQQMESKGWVFDDEIGIAKISRSISDEESQQIIEWTEANWQKLYGDEKNKE